MINTVGVGNLGEDSQENAPTPKSTSEVNSNNNPKQEEVSTTINNTNSVLFKELQMAHTIEQKATHFGKLMDSYGRDTILGFLGLDIGTSLVATLYLLYQGSKIGLSLKDRLKIVGYQVADIVVGIIPGLDLITDTLFKANKYSANLFTEHLKKLEQVAIEKGLPPTEIEKLRAENTKALTALTEKDKEQEKVAA